ncbi:Hypothetical Protein CGB_G6130W [Cryptococcus gattii WM276]|uniref:HTH CENPB-type domain-containing protein n=1 Tax=Cryptococcus gattii serotype B (strain WM276 / ATCC MYA-4071) TaxID=367775 RepID=E6RA09_CRYGW|nr:Hypothetical Protein CGB_G6130W [Cryptococcus gattii WM276]ADV23647.1 Hypothetical Protein CGB_G6130W [Cryptococcus gattii WM276]
MDDSIDLAVQHKREHPEESYKDVADAYKIPKSTLYNRRTFQHASRAAAVPRRLSIEQEEQLILKINEYASRGTLLAPRHVKELAEAICESSLGVNWTGRFVQRHKDRLHSRYFDFQELARFQADKIETRRAFYTLVSFYDPLADRFNPILASFPTRQVKDLYETGLYAPHLIINMDEAGFDLGYKRKARRIASRTHLPIRQAVPPSNEQITTIATIGIDSAPVPPLIIYQGEHLQDSWTSTHDKDICQLACVTQSGWNNSYIMLKWLEDVFDPYTRGLAHDGRDPRLLFLDGAQSHTKVAFLEACWARNIVVVLLPTSPIGSGGQRVLKGMFYLWHQRAWAQVATPRQIRNAWRKSGLWPLNKEVMDVDPHTPPPQHAAKVPLTPNNFRILRANNLAVKKGELDPRVALEKTEKALAKALADKALLECELKGFRAAEQATRAARGSRKRQRYPEGQLFDPLYQEEHAGELVVRKAEEEEARRKRRRTARVKRSGTAPNVVRACTPRPTGTS